MQYCRNKSCHWAIAVQCNIAETSNTLPLGHCNAIKYCSSKQYNTTGSLPLASLVGPGLARAGLAGLLGWLARGWLALHPFTRSLSGKNNKKNGTKFTKS
jgi:hypothetical protein